MARYPSFFELMTVLARQLREDPDHAPGPRGARHEAHEPTEVQKNGGGRAGLRWLF